MPLLSIIVPVHNEENILKRSLPPIFDLDINKEIIVVNDGSTDNSFKILQDFKNKRNFKLIHTENNLGKGQAIRAALNHVNGKYFTICDADMEYNPKELLKLLYHIQNNSNKKTAVYGSRFLSNHHFSFHYFVNAFLTKLTNLLFSSNLTDMETCFKLIPEKAIQKLKLTANRFEIEPQITAQLLKNGYKIIELPISYARRNYKEGKKIKPKDGVLAVWMLIKEKII